MTEARFVVVGSRGAVGRELLTMLAARGVPDARIARVSRRAEGNAAALDGFEFRPDDVAFFCVEADVSRAAVPRAEAAGARVIDLSSAFRRDAATPLVVPEVNGDTIVAGARRVANPNCTAILLCVVLAPIERACGLERVVVATYQAVSGAGTAGLDALRESTRAALDGDPHEADVFPEPIAFNVFSHESAVDPTTGRNREEEKVVHETRRILGRDDLPIAVTCMRVPVERAHTEVVNLALRSPMSEAELRAVLAGAPSISIVDDRGAGRFPTPRRASERDDVLVGRLRPDPSWPTETPADGGAPRHLGFSLLLCGDQLRKGAAGNALAIMDRWERVVPPGGSS